MRARDKFWALLNVEPGEERLVSLLLATSFCVGSANVFVYTAAFALFLTEFDAQALPYTYIGISIVVTLFSFLYMKLSEYLSFSSLLMATGVFLVLVLLGLRLGLGLTGASWLVFSLPIVAELLWALANLAFWNLAGYLFNVRQGKRLFGLIGAGEHLAALLAGLLIPLLVVLIGTANLLLVGALASAGILTLTLYLSRDYGDTIAASLEEEEDEEQRSTGQLLKNRYILLIFGLFALGIVAYYAIDNIFYLQAEAQFAGEDQLAAFIGVFSAVVGLLTLLSSSFLSGPLINRYGVRAGLLCTPLLLLLCGLLVAGIGTAWGGIALLFWLVALMQLMNLVFTESVDVHAINILYQPLPASLRVQTQTVVEGIVYSLAVGLAGILLTVLTGFFALGPLQLTYFLLVVLLAWMGAAVLLSREYPKMLIQALAQRRLGGIQWSLLADSSSVGILQRELQSSHAGAVIYAMSGLEAINPALLTEPLPRLLEHPAPEVRQDSLERTRRLNLTSALPAVGRRVIQEPVAIVRGTALRTLAALGGSEAVETVAAYLEDPVPAVRRGAMVGLLRSGGIEGILAAGQRLLQSAGSQVPAERAFAAGVLGRVGQATFYRPLVPLLQDAEPEVQRKALLAAGQVKNDRLWPLILEKVAHPETRGAAVSALAAGGEPVVPYIADACTQEGQQPHVIDPLVAACGRIGGETATLWLKAQLGYPHAGVRTTVLRALSHCGYRASEAEAGRVREKIRTEAALAAETLAALADIGDDPAVALLRGALDDALVQIQARVFFLLSFIYDRRSILQARDNLSLPSEEKRAFALEVIDVQVAQDLKAICFPLLNDLPSSHRAQQLQVLFPQPQMDREQRLQSIIAGTPGRYTTWSAACALYAVGRLPATRLAGEVATALSAPDPLLRETAIWALSRLDGNGYCQRLKALCQDPNPQVARAARELATGRGQEDLMLSTLEKTIILKKASVFAETPDETLAAVAVLLKEMPLGAGETVFERGDFGDRMYIMVNGEVCVHNQGRTLNHLGAGEVFGEMALLDPEPRMASVTAVSDSLLLCLDQGPFYELMGDRPEVAQGIIRVLCQRLRARVEELNQARALVGAEAPGASED